MPRPPEVDDITQPLIDAYTAAGAEIRRRIRAALDLLEQPADQATRAARRRRVRRLEQLERLIVAELDQIEAITRRWLEEDFPTTYVISSQAAAAALGGTFAVTPSTVRAVELLARDSWESTLAATRYVRDDTKATIRRLAAEAGRLTGTAGDTSTQAAQRAARRAAERGIGTVRYRNGARHGIDTYMTMNLRTKVALAHAHASLSVYTAAGIQYVELTDGPSCGLLSHNSPPLANGMIVPVDLYQAFPLSHPNCRRDALPRPDLNGRSPDGAASAGSLRSPDQIEALADYQRQLDTQRENRTRRRQAAARAT